MRIAFYEAFEEEADALRRALANSPVAGDVDATFTWQTIQEAHPDIPPAPPAEVISVRTQSALPERWAPSLAGIVTRSTGYDHILAYRDATGVGVPAGSLPLYCNRAVAEHAMLTWMMLLRKAHQQREQFPTFARDGITGLECAGKTLLVVGVGNIGSEIVKIGDGLGMRTIAHDLVHTWDFADYNDDINHAIAHADIIACAMNLTPQNHGYFSRELLLRAPAGAIFVNVSRGELSPSTVLLDLLESGHLAGVSLDVFDQEKALAAHLRDNQPLPADPAARAEIEAAIALARRPDAVITPHNAFNTAEAVDRKAGHAILQIESLIKSGSFKWPVVAPGATAGTATATP